MLYDEYRKLIVTRRFSFVMSASRCVIVDTYEQQASEVLEIRMLPSFVIADERLDTGRQYRNAIIGENESMSVAQRRYER